MIILFDGDALCWRASCCKKDPTLKQCLSACNNMIHKAFSKYDTRDYRMPLTSTDRSNFRFEIAKTKEYKGNRKGKPKPAQFWNVREHLIRRYGGVEVFGMEADDWLGIEQCYYAEHGRESVIYAEDKDLKQIPGRHCNFRGEEEIVDEFGYLKLDKNWNIKVPKLYLKGAGLKWFYAQCITGDGCDNIPGIHKKGPKAAFEALHLCKNELELYRKTLEVFGGNRELFEEMAQLCWILKKEGEFWPDRKKRLLLGEINTGQSGND